MRVVRVAAVVAVLYAGLAIATSSVNFWTPAGGDGVTYIHGAWTLTQDVPYHTFEKWPDIPGRSIAYPAILSLLRVTERDSVPYAAFVWNVAMYALAVYAGSRIAQRFGFSNWSVVPVMWMGLPLVVMMLSDLTALAALYGGIAVLIDRRSVRSALVAGVLFGVAALTRNAAMSLAVVGVLVALSAIGWRRVVVSIATMLVVVAPYATYHFHRTGAYAVETLGARYQIAVRTIPSINNRGDLRGMAEESSELVLNKVPSDPSERADWEMRHIREWLTQLPSPLVLMDYAVSMPGWMLFYSTGDIRSPWPGVIPHWAVSAVACATGSIWLLCAFVAVRRLRVKELLGISTALGIVTMQSVLMGPLTLDRIILPASIVIGMVYAAAWRSYAD